MVSEQFRDERAKSATECTLEVEPTAWSWAGPACPESRRSDPWPWRAGAFGSRRREWSEERLEFAGAEACASLGSAGLSARAFPPTGALNVGYLSTQEPG